MDLFLRFGVIAAAGDRHLAEFCPGKWYLENPETVRGVYHFNLTPVSYRKGDLKVRLEKSDDYYTGKLAPELRESGEEGVQMLCALIGLGDMVTNVNIPNKGQIPNLPIGAIVETNAAFRAGSITPIMAGNVPVSIYPLISRVVGEQEMVLEAAMTKNLDLAFEAFCCDPLVTISHTDAKVLFDKMIETTKEYLSMYGI
jgi:alpha-galactosidase